MLDFFLKIVKNKLFLTMTVLNVLLTLTISLLFNYQYIEGLISEVMNIKGLTIYLSLLFLMIYITLIYPLIREYFQKTNNNFSLYAVTTVVAFAVNALSLIIILPVLNIFLKNIIGVALKDFTFISMPILLTTLLISLLLNFTLYNVAYLINIIKGDNDGNKDKRSENNIYNRLKLSNSKISFIYYIVTLIISIAVTYGKTGIYQKILGILILGISIYFLILTTINVYNNKNNSHQTEKKVSKIKLNTISLFKTIIITLLISTTIILSTIGLSFKNDPINVVNNAVPYDILVVDIDKAQQSLIDKTNVESQDVYQTKFHNNTIYYMKEEIDKNPIYISNNTFGNNTFIPIPLTSAGFEADFRKSQLQYIYGGYHNPHSAEIVSKEEFDKIPGTIENLNLIKISDFKQKIKVLDELITYTAQKDNMDRDSYGSKVDVYKVVEDTYLPLSYIVAMVMFIFFGLLILIVGLGSTKIRENILNCKENNSFDYKDVKDNKNNAVAKRINLIYGKEFLIFEFIPFFLVAIILISLVPTFRKFFITFNQNLYCTLIAIAIMYLIIYIYNILRIRKELKKEIK